jgi:glycosyltransferase involved in cell wall biosynthesis
MNNEENRFVIICPMFNCGSTLTRLLHSLFGQSYFNWKLILLDDMSDQHEREECARIITTFKTLRKTDCKRVKVVWNDRKKWEMENVLYGIKEFCLDDDIVCRCDGDDFLSELDAFYIINQYYVQTKCDVAWTMHRWGFTDNNISGPMQPGIDPYAQKWSASHFKTFRKYLINDIPYENFLNQNNELIKRTGDQGLYLPVLSKAQNAVFIPRVMYHYSIKLEKETFQSDDAKFQKEEAEFIRKRGFVSTGESWDKMIKC